MKYKIISKGVNTHEFSKHRLTNCWFFAILMLFDKRITKLLIRKSNTDTCIHLLVMTKNNIILHLTTYKGIKKFGIPIYIERNT